MLTQFRTNNSDKVGEWFERNKGQTDRLSCVKKPKGTDNSNN